MCARRLDAPRTYRRRDLSIACRQRTELPRYPHPKRARHHFRGQRVALANGVAIKLDLITLLDSDRYPVPGEPIQLIIGLPAPDQDSSGQPNPVSERTRRSDQQIQHPVVGSCPGNQLNVGQDETDIANDDEMCSAPDRRLIIDRNRGMHSGMVRVLRCRNKIGS